MRLICSYTLVFIQAYHACTTGDLTHAWALPTDTGITATHNRKTKCPYFAVFKPCSLPTLQSYATREPRWHFAPAHV